jgi:hypothetical protein
MIFGGFSFQSFGVHFCKLTNYKFYLLVFYLQFCRRIVEKFLDEVAQLPFLNGFNVRGVEPISECVHDYLWFLLQRSVNKIFAVIVDVVDIDGFQQWVFTVHNSKRWVLVHINYDFSVCDF